MPQLLELMCKPSRRLDQFQPEVCAIWYDLHHKLDSHTASYGAGLHNYNIPRAHTKQLHG